MKNFVSLIIGTLLLCGCTNPEFKKPEGWQSYANTKFAYEIAVPTEVTGKNLPEDDWVAFGTYSALAEKPTEKDFTINVHAGSELPPHANCSPALTGASVTTPLTDANGKAEWGKVPNQEKSIDPNYPNALCKASREECKGNPSFEYASGCDTPSAAYALCAEKDGKTVVICIDQMKDDPKMAQQIFETFRWVK